MTRMEATYEHLIEELPPPLATYGVGLPYKLGLTADPAGGWEDFWILDPNRRPERYTADRISDPLGAEDAERWAGAHHCAVFFGLVYDRVADDQVPPVQPLLSTRRAFRLAWERKLAVAAADEAAARETVARSMVALRRGVHLERAAFDNGRLEVDDYATQTRDKLRWSVATPWCQLRLGASERTANLFERCFDLLGMAVQCTDDGVDGEDDRAVRGTSVPSLLGIPDGGLVMAAAGLVKRATELACSGGFYGLARWLDKFQQFLGNARPEGDAEENRRLGEALGARLGEVLCATPI